ncbi:MAG: type II secretion system protein GspD [Methylophilus sp.]
MFIRFLEGLLMMVMFSMLKGLSMFIRAFSFLLLFYSVSASAVTLEFNNLPIKEVSHVFFKTILKKDFILSNDLIQDNRLVTISVKDIPQKSLVSDLTNILKSQGISITEKNNIFYLDLIKQNEAVNQIQSKLEEPKTEQGASSPDYDNMRIYRPLYQSIQNLLPVFASFKITPNHSPESDSIIFEAKEEHYQKLLTLLSLIDKPNNQLLVQAYLYEFSENETASNGFNVALNLLNSKLNINLNTSKFANTITATFKDFQAVISALDTDSRFTVVSSPTLRLTNGKLSKFSVGTETPVLGAIQNNGNGVSTQSVTYRPSGVIFEVKPTILESTIQLDLNQQVSNFVKTTSGVNDTPTLIKREINTSLNVRDGDIVMIGGLADSKDSKQHSGLSILPSFLKSKTSDKSKSDIFLILQVTKI